MAKGESKAITFSEPGDLLLHLCAAPWMYGQVIVDTEREQRSCLGCGAAERCLL